jgi:hypothetical protein
MTASGWTNRCPRKPGAAHTSLNHGRPLTGAVAHGTAKLLLGHLRPDGALEHVRHLDPAVDEVHDQTCPVPHFRTHGVEEVRGGEYPCHIVLQPGIQGLDNPPTWFLSGNLPI